MDNFKIASTIENTLAVLVTQAGYVGIGVDTSAAAIPPEVLNQFTFNDKGVSENTLSATFDFTTVTGQRKIEWKTEDGKDQHSFVLEGVTVTQGQKTFTTSIPYEGYLQMKASGEAKAVFTLKKSFNKAGTRSYYSTRLVGLTTTTPANSGKVDTTAAPAVTMPKQ